MEFNAEMTTATVKPRTLDKEGFTKTPEYLAITLRADLNAFTDTELGKLLSLAAVGDELQITVEPRQGRLDMGSQNGGAEDDEETPKNNYPSVADINKLVAQLQKQEEYKDWSLADLSHKAREILLEDTPF